MKKKILLVCESLTVQKVVSLSLEKSRYTLSFAKTRAEAMKLVIDEASDLILVSDSVSDINSASFPKEVETWIGGSRISPPVVLISAQEVKDQKHYAAILKKPFSPQALQSIVLQYTNSGEYEAGHQDFRTFNKQDEFEDQRLQQIFNDTFNDESSLMKETFRVDSQGRSEQFSGQMTNKDLESTDSWISDKPSLWGAKQQEEIPKRPSSDTANNSSQKEDTLWSINPGGGEASQKNLNQNDRLVALEKSVEANLDEQGLNEIVSKILDKVVPPIVERLARERLDELLAEQQKFIELKP